MDIQDLGNLGEFVAAIATLATLAYLAVQIRQSNRIATWDAHRSSVIEYNSIMRHVISDPSMARIFREGLIDLDRLDDDDRVRLFVLIGELVLHFKDVLAAHDQGIYDAQTYEAWEGFICALLNTKTGALWWEENRGSFIGRVREKIDAGRPEVGSYTDLLPLLFGARSRGGTVRASNRDTWTGVAGQAGRES